mgnify:FL=1
MYDYGCLMLDFQIKGWSNLKQYIGVYDDDLVEPMPQDPHCTVCYGFSNEVDPEYLSKICPSLGLFDFVITDVGCFKNEDSDVVHFVLKSQTATALNSVLTNTFNVTVTHPEYTPHMTIGFFKANCSDKYLKKIKYQKNTKIRPYRYRYSYPSGNEYYF